jgi:hypothetical protein
MNSKKSGPIVRISKVRPTAWTLRTKGLTGVGPSGPTRLIWVVCVTCDSSELAFTVSIHLACAPFPGRSGRKAKSVAEFAD